MIKRLSKKTVSELVEELKNTEIDSDEYFRKRQQLIVARSIDGAYFQGIRRVITSRIGELDQIIAADRLDTRKLNRVFRSIRAQITEQFRSGITRAAEDSANDVISHLDRQLTPSQKRAASGLFIDSNGNAMPRPGTPENIRGRQLSREEILEAAAPLLHISGDGSLEKSSPSIASLFSISALSSVAVRTIFENIAGSWLARLRDGFRNWLQARRIARAHKRGGPQAAMKALDKSLGIRSSPDSGLIPRVRAELRHETLKVNGVIMDEVTEMLDPIVGFELNSRFLDTSDPVHIRNDGNKYFKDNREGSASRWVNRLLPPYRKNCVCWRRLIFEDVEGETYFATWTAIPIRSGGIKVREADVGARIWDPDHVFADGRIGGFRTITEEDVGNIVGKDDQIQPRDVGTYVSWFNAQSARDRRELVGDNRFDAVLDKVNRPGYEPQYEDFVDIFGKWLRPNQIQREGVASRRLRITNVKSVIGTLQENARKAWRAGGDRWQLNPREERAHVRRVRFFIDRYLKRKSLR